MDFIYSDSERIVKIFFFYKLMFFEFSLKFNLCRKKYTMIYILINTNLYYAYLHYVTILIKLQKDRNITVLFFCRKIMRIVSLMESVVIKHVMHAFKNLFYIECFFFF